MAGRIKLGTRLEVVQTRKGQPVETRLEVLFKREMNRTKEPEVDHGQVTKVLMHLPGGERLPGHLES